jgi:hypothetical protein
MFSNSLEATKEPLEERTIRLKLRDKLGVAHNIESLPGRFARARWREPHGVFAAIQALHGDLDAFLGGEVFIHGDIHKLASTCVFRGRRSGFAVDLDPLGKADLACSMGRGPLDAAGVAGPVARAAFFFLSLVSEDVLTGSPTLFSGRRRRRVRQGQPWRRFGLVCRHGSIEERQ